jgi:hypothetical protein
VRYVRFGTAAGCETRFRIPSGSYRATCQLQGGGVNAALAGSNGTFAICPFDIVLGVGDYGLGGVVSSGCSAGLGGGTGCSPGGSVTISVHPQ